MATDTYKYQAGNILSGSKSFEAITPDDATQLTRLPRAIYIGGAGDLIVQGQDDTTDTTFVGLSAGQVLDIRPKFVKATGTTATNIVALY